MRSRANASDFTSSVTPGVWTYTDWDQRHTLNAVAAYRHKDWEHNFQFFWGSGLADAVTADTAEYQGHAPDAFVFSWNIIKKLPEGSRLGDHVFLNIWNVFNTGKPTHFYVYPDGSKEAETYITPRFITLGVVKKF